MKVRDLTLLAGLFLLTSSLFLAHATCEAGCNSETDRVQFVQLNGHIDVLEDISAKTTSLTKNASKNFQQLTQLIDAKKQHLQDFNQILTDYFLTHRIHLPAENNGKAERLYQEQLSFIHKLLLLSASLNAENDLAYPGAMRKVLKEFAKSFEQAQKA